MLNVLAFILVGFQLKIIATGMTRATGVHYATVGVAVCPAVIPARIAWVMGAAAFSRWRSAVGADGRPGQRNPVALSPGAAAVVGWCGMRGMLTLAAALALPTSGEGGTRLPYELRLRRAEEIAGDGAVVLPLLVVDRRKPR